MKDDRELILGLAELAALLDVWEARCDYDDEKEAEATGRAQMILEALHAAEKERK